MIRRWLRALRCWNGSCPGTVISGYRDGVLHVGWKCSNCQKIKYYEPSVVR